MLSGHSTPGCKVYLCVVWSLWFVLREFISGLSSDRCGRRETTGLRPNHSWRHVGTSRPGGHDQRQQAGGTQSGQRGGHQDGGTQPGQQVGWSPGWRDTVGTARWSPGWRTRKLLKTSFWPSPFTKIAYCHSFFLLFVSLRIILKIWQILLFWQKSVLLILGFLHNFMVDLERLSSHRSMKIVSWPWCFFGYTKIKKKRNTIFFKLNLNGIGILDTWFAK